MNAAIFSPLIRLVSPLDPTLEGVARRLALPTAGTVVFNPSPFGQSGVVALPAGGLRLVTDVPGLGYAFEPDTEAARRNAETVPAREPVAPVETPLFSARLDERTGALASLVDRTAGRELVAPGGALNAVDPGALADAWIERYPGVGIRLLSRRTGTTGDFTSRVTIYDALPWVDIENVADAGSAPAADTRFDLALEPRAVTREVAGGAVTGAAPLERAPMLRWIALAAGDDTLLVGSAWPATVTVTATGRLTLHEPAGGTRFRIAARRGVVLPDEPWRFGFSMAPLLAARAPGSGGLRLPTFGRMLDVADPAVAVVGLKHADDGVGLMVYLMDLAGVGREVVVRAGLLTFDGAAATDLTERDRAPLPAAPGGGVVVPVEAGGYAAFRLLGVRVAG